MNILFRADSSSTIGTGHIMRDLVLAEQFSDANVIFATQELPKNINHKIKEKNYEIVILNSNDIEELIAIIKKRSIDMIIIDHYGIDNDYEKALKEATGITIFVLDDTYEKHYCDILLNHNIYADATRYKGLVPSRCELRCGERYTLLRDEFEKAKKNNKIINTSKVKNIFIAMGGTDIQNLNPKILKVLETFKDIHVNIATTNANPHLEELELYINDKEWITLHINSQEIAKLMAKSDLAIVTPSVTMNEVWYMELPFIAIQTAFNQSCMTKFLKQNNYYALESFDVNELSQLLNRSISSDTNSTLEFNQWKKMTSLFIITGTTQGLGKALLNSLKADNMILTINRKDIRYKQKNLHNLNLDLSNLDLNKINDFEIVLSRLITKNITKIVFINNAFTMGRLAKIDTLNNSEIINSINTNVISSFLLIKCFISVSKHLHIDKRILNISSGAAKKAIDGWSIYCVSKSSLEMLIESIKVEYNDYQCFSIDPGVIDTNMQSAIRSFTDGINNEYFVELHKTNKLKEPTEIANQIIEEYFS